MPTIKRKVEMNLVGLLEWAWENGIKNKYFESSNTDRAGIAEVSFDDYGDFNSEYNVPKDVYFTVEIEEEITEGTRIPRLFVRYVDESFGEKYEVSLSHVCSPRVKAAYLPNDDLTMTLIWTKEKGLVD